MLDLPTPNLDDLTQARRARARDLLAAAGADLLVVGSPENVFYVTGYESMPASINRRHDYAALLTSGRCLLVCPAIDLAAAVGGGIPREDVFPFGTFYFSGRCDGAHMTAVHSSFDEAFAAAVASAGAPKVVAEVDALPAVARRSLPETTDSAGAQLMLRIRSRKLPGELVLMRRATEITQDAIEAGIAAAALGVTDKQIAAVVAARMSAGGGFTRNVTVVGGAHSAYADAMPANRPLSPGDLLRFDVGCSYFGYKSDMARTAVMGPPTALQADRYEALLQGLLAEIAVIRPGISVSEVFQAGMDRIAEAGFVDFRRHHLGHAIGLAVYEWPVIVPRSTDLIEEGSVYCLETPYYEPGWGGMMCEDTGVITADGFQTFSTIDRSLRQIG